MYSKAAEKPDGVFENEPNKPIINVQTNENLSTIMGTAIIIICPCFSGHCKPGWFIPRFFQFTRLVMY